MDRKQKTVTEDEARTLLECFPACTGVRECYDSADVVRYVAEDGSLGEWIDGELHVESIRLDRRLDAYERTPEEIAAIEQEHAQRMHEVYANLRVLGLLRDAGGDL